MLIGEGIPKFNKKIIYIHNKVKLNYALQFDRC